MAHRAWPGEPIVAAYVPPAIGWADPIDLGEDGYTVLHSNAGVENEDGNYNSRVLYYCGVENYVEGMVVEWSGSFDRTEPGSGDPDPPPEPFVTPLPGGLAVVDIGSAQEFVDFAIGLYTLTATVDGVACPAIMLSIDSQYYSTVAWGPA